MKGYIWILLIGGFVTWFLYQSKWAYAWIAGLITAVWAAVSFQQGG